MMGGFSVDYICSLHSMNYSFINSHGSENRRITIILLGSCKNHSRVSFFLFSPIVIWLSEWMGSWTWIGYILLIILLSQTQNRHEVWGYNARELPPTSIWCTKLFSFFTPSRKIKQASPLLVNHNNIARQTVSSVNCDSTQLLWRLFTSWA